jgi:hypothetical protein
MKAVDRRYRVWAHQGSQSKTPRGTASRLRHLQTMTQTVDTGELQIYTDIIQHAYTDGARI